MREGDELLLSHKETRSLIDLKADESESVNDRSRDVVENESFISYDVS